MLVTVRGRSKRQDLKSPLAKKVVMRNIFRLQIVLDLRLPGGGNDYGNTDWIHARVVQGLAHGDRYRRDLGGGAHSLEF